MFVRKNRNRNGAVSVQIISKQAGSYRVVQTIGCSSDPNEIERLATEGKSLLHRHENQLKLFSLQSPEAEAAGKFFRNAGQGRRVFPMERSFVRGSVFSGKNGYGLGYERRKGNKTPHAGARHAPKNSGGSHDTCEQAGYRSVM